MAIDRSSLSNAAIAISFSWFVKMTGPEVWDLTNSEAAALLNIDEAEYVDMLSENEALPLSSETIGRLSLLLGIWKMLQLWAPVDRQDIAILAFKKPGAFAALNGKSIKQHLIDGGSVETFYEVKCILRS